MKTKTLVKKLLIHIAIILFGLLMFYPIVWLFFASFKESAEVLNSYKILPETFHFENYVTGWHLVYPYTFDRFFLNSFMLVILCIIGSLMISLVVGYGFARFDFKLKGFLFSILFLTIMLPTTTTLVSKYLIFSKLGWLNTLLPFAVPSFLGVGVGGGFFIYLLYQFIRGIPRELDESAEIDGCSTFRIMTNIILPLAKSALFSVMIFAFLWNWDDFQNQLIYLSDVRKFTIPLALRATTDVAGTSNWGAIMAMSFCSMIPAIVLFFSLQRYFVEGISTSGIKG